MDNEQNAATQIMQIITAKWISEPLHVVTKLGIPDILNSGEKTIDQLAKTCEVQEQQLYRVMKTLASIGIFMETAPRSFSQTPMSECLQENKLKPAALMFLSEWHNRAWENLYYAVKTGKNAFEKAHEKPCFKWLAENSKESHIFNQANAVKARTTHAVILDVYDFSPFQSICDIGGGYGGLLFSLLVAKNELTGIVADLPHLSDHVNKQILERQLTERCEYVSCDFFDHIPAGKDCYLLSNIFHDWNDERCCKILTKCFEAMDENAKMLIIESILPEGNEFSTARLLDLEVMVMGDGQERTESEFRKLISGSGFSINSVINTEESISILECKKNQI